MALTTTQINQLYVSYFGRPADFAGVQFYTTANATPNQVAAAFAASAESQALYGGLSVSQQVTAIYQNLFNRAPEVAGLTYWTQQIVSGNVTAAAAALAIGNAAQGDDRSAIVNKVLVANSFVAALDTTAEINGYSGAAAAASARTFLSTVGSTAASLTTAQAQVDAQVALATAQGGVTGAVTALTTGVDTLVGTAGNDTFNALIDTSIPANTTFSAADSINGGAGNDTLNVVIQGTAGGAAPFSLPALTNVETLNVRSVDSGTTPTVTFSAVNTGLTAVNLDRSVGSLTVTDLAAGASAGKIGAGVGDLTFGYATGVTAATLNLSGGTTSTTTNGVTTGNVTLNSTAVTSVVVNSTGAANTIGTLDLSAGTATAVTSLTVNAASNLTAALAPDYAANAALVVSGAASRVALTNGIAANFATIDASGLTVGGLTVGLGTNTTSFKGGAGNDIVTTAAVATTTASSINAGTGSADRLIVGATAHVDTAAEAAVYAGFDILQAGNNVTVDASLFTNSTITGLRTSGTATFNGLNATQAANVTFTADGAGTFNLTGATNVGQIDTLGLRIDDGATAVNTIALADITAAGVEQITVAATDNVTIASLKGATALTSLTLSGAGNIAVTTGALALNVNSKIDASAATGTVFIDASAATGNGLAITGSATGANTLAGTVRSDIIVGGAGNDIISGTALTLTTTGAVDTVANSTAADVLTGGAGNDTFAIGLVDSLANISSITDLNFGSSAAAGRVDTLVLNTAATGSATVVTLTTAQQATVTAATTFAAAVDAALSAATAAGAVAQFTYGSDTYLVANGVVAGAGGANAFTAAEDVVVKITGVTGTLDASDIILI